MVSTLAPGGYSAQVSGAANGTGLAILELYEVGATAGSSRLVNLSSRSFVNTGANVLISGITVAPGGGSRKLLIRAAGPALTALGVPGALTDPTLTVTNAAGTVTYASNDNWTTPVATATADAALLAATFTRAGAFAFPAGSKDSAVLADFAPGGYTVVVSGVGAATGVALVEVYDVTSGATPTVSIAATKSAADESGTNPGEITLTRTGDLFFPLTATYTVGGSAINGYDYPYLSGSATFPSGVSTLKIPVAPNPDVQVEGTDTVTLTLTSSPSYTIASAPTATITIADSPATLYLAAVRPTGTAISGSTASGTATILLSSSGTVASVNITFTGLSSTQVTAHLTIGANEDYVFNLPSGQVSGAQWTFAPAGAYSTAALLDALKTGNISVRIDSANFPGGELKGSFIQSTGSRTFTAPPAAPAAILTGVTATDAARFLTQATFGPTKAEIDTLTGGNLDTWITAQLALPFTSHYVATRADRASFGGSNSYTNWNATHLQNRQSAWFKTVLTAPDQLRQRVAYALSQILVISDISLGEDSHTEPVANYYDILGNGAFGNFRTLLENVTLSPMMGMYLSSLRNAKADPVTGQTPDENYAREIMQLFTIGLDQLQPDGTLLLDASGLPIPTYDQTTITELAKVFTGWAYPSSNLNNFRTGSTNYITPMQLFPAFHDNTEKKLSPVATSIPADTSAASGTNDLRLALDALCNHPNTAPFISKLFIQRLVTSNPSPGYVYRVAQVWTAQKSSSTQLAAVVHAILTDYEARSPAVAATVTYGKLKEPLLRLTAVMRTFGASSTSGRYLGYRHTASGTPITSATPLPALATDIATINSSTLPYNALGSLSQAALRSPTVFNFYHPDYVLPGPLAAAGLVAPEFEITDDNFAISVPNYLRLFATAAIPTTGGVPTTAAPYVITLNTAYEQSLVTTPAALLDHLNTVLCAGTLPAAARTRITAALAALPVSTTTEDRAKTAIFLVLTSPAAAIQK